MSFLLTHLTHILSKTVQVVFVYTDTKTSSWRCKWCPRNPRPSILIGGNDIKTSSGTVVLVKKNISSGFEFVKLNQSCIKK